MYRQYIDPGTGSMLFTIIIGLLTTAVFLLRGVWIKLKTRLHGGRGSIGRDAEKIEYLIFSDSKRYWTVFRPICEEFDKRGIDFTYWTMSEDDPALTCGLEHIHAQFIGEGNAAFGRLNMMNARICLSTTPGLNVLQWKRSPRTDCYVHIFHSVSDGTGYRMFGIDCYDAVLLSGEVAREPLRTLEAMRHLPEKEIALTGCPYMDTMLARKKALPELPREGHLPTILCAPSWGPSSILNRFGDKILKALVDTGYHIVVRPHPQSLTSDPELLDRLRRDFPESSGFEWNFDNDNFDVLSRSDLLISDFSSVIFDFAFIFDRPVICADTSFDCAPYDIAWLEGRKPWAIEVAQTFGKPLKESEFGNMKAILDEVLTSAQYTQAREEARALAWAYPGEGAVRIVDYLTAKAKRLSGEAHASVSENAD